MGEGGAGEKLSTFLKKQKKINVKITSATLSSFKKQEREVDLRDVWGAMHTSTLLVVNATFNVALMQVFFFCLKPR